MNEKYEIGSVVKLEIRKTGINGEGIGYLDQTTVFINGAMEKEVVSARIKEIHDTYLVAELVEVIDKSKMRVEPFCKFFGECGACTMQHIDYTMQLKIKRNILISSLKKYAPSLNLDETKIHLTTPSDEISYRNKSQMPFRDTNFGLSLGLYQEGTNKFIFIDKCGIESDGVNEIKKLVLTCLIKYNQSTKKNGGVLKYLVVRYLDGEAQVTFVLDEYRDIYKEIAKELMSKTSDIRTVAYTISNKNSVSIFGDEVHILEGVNYINGDILGLRIKLSPKSFFQLNKGQSEKLYKEIVDSIEDDNSIIFDGYSGIGVLGLLSARKVKHVYSVDLSSDSIKNARINARENGIKNITFFSDRIENRFPTLIKEGINPDVIIIDPPRSGLSDKVMDAILKSGAKKIYYVSCNTSTLAKNLNVLLKKYDVSYLRPYDFFVETALVETLCCLVKR